MTKSLLYFICFLCCVKMTTVLCDCDLMDNYFFIRNRVSGLVLDYTNWRKGVTIQPYDASNIYQRFKLKPASRTGLFNIYRPISLHETLTYTPLGGRENESNLTMDVGTSSIYMEWFLNSDGTLVNAGMLNQGIMVDQSPFYTGNYVILVPSANFTTDQQWDLTNLTPDDSDDL